MAEKKKSCPFSRFAAWVNGDTADRILQVEDSAPAKEKKHKRKEKYSPKKEWHQYEQFDHFYRLCAIVIGVAMVAVLMITVTQLPLFGHPDNPVVNEMSQRYVEKGLEETVRADPRRRRQPEDAKPDQLQRLRRPMSEQGGSARSSARDRPQPRRRCNPMSPGHSKGIHRLY